MTTITGLRLGTSPVDEPTGVELPAGNLLHSLYAAIGCRFIDVIELPGGLDVVFDDEGKNIGADPNHLATAIAKRLGFTFFPGDYIAGPVVFLGATGEGEHVSLTADQRHRLLVASLVVGQ